MTIPARLRYQCRPNGISATPRSPQYTLVELAAHFGVLKGQLVSAMRRVEVKHPEPNMKLGKGTLAHYDLAAMSKWWDEIGGAEFAVSKMADYYTNYRKQRREEGQGAEECAQQ